MSRGVSASAHKPGTTPEVTTEARFGPARLRPILLLLYSVPLMVIVKGLAIHLNVPLNHDVAWLLIAAGRMLAHGSYSNDFFEVNMPLAIGIYIPPHFLARWFGQSIPMANLAWTFILVIQSAGLSTLLTPVDRKPHGIGLEPVWMAWILFGLIFLPGYDFGQKEHLVIVLTLPFLTLLTNSSRGASPALRVYVSCLAGVGFFLKPHFAFLPLLLLGWMALREKSWKPLWSVEAITLLAVGALNAMIVFEHFPDWFLCARWAGDLYGAYQAASWKGLFLIDSMPIFGIVGIFLLLLALRNANFRSMAWPLLLAAVYGWLAYLLQFKGWTYQFLPVSIPLFLALGLACLNSIANSTVDVPRGRTIAIVYASITALTVGQVIYQTRDLPTIAQLERSVTGQAFSLAKKGDYVYAFTTTVVPVFPTVVEMDLNWASRYPALWPLAGLAQARARDGVETADHLQDLYGATLLTSVTDDLERFSPSVVLVDQRIGQFGLPRDYNILDYFLGDARFRQIWGRYKEFGTGGGFAIYLRT